MFVGTERQRQRGERGQKEERGEERDEEGERKASVFFCQTLRGASAAVHERQVQSCVDGNLGEPQVGKWVLGTQADSASSAGERGRRKEGVERVVMP